MEERETVQRQGKELKTDLYRRATWAGHEGWINVPHEGGSCTRGISGRGNVRARGRVKSRQADARAGVEKRRQKVLSPAWLSVGPNWQPAQCTQTSLLMFLRWTCKNKTRPNQTPDLCLAHHKHSMPSALTILWHFGCPIHPFIFGVPRIENNSQIRVEWRTCGFWEGNGSGQDSHATSSRKVKAMCFLQERLRHLKIIYSSQICQVGQTTGLKTTATKPYSCTAFSACLKRVQFLNPKFLTSCLNPISATAWNSHLWVWVPASLHRGKIGSNFKQLAESLLTPAPTWLRHLLPQESQEGTERSEDTSFNFLNDNIAVQPQFSSIPHLLRKVLWAAYVLKHTYSVSLAWN